MRLFVLQNGVYFLFAEKLSSKGFFSIEMIYFKQPEFEIRIPFLPFFFSRKDFIALIAI